MANIVLLALASLLAIAGVYDLCSRRVPNALVLLLFVTGVGSALASAGILGAGRSALFAVLGLAIWLPFYALRMMGAGDVKLFAAGCAWLASLSQVLSAAAATALVGGVLALVWAIAQRRTIAAIGNVLTTVRFRIRVPFDTHAAKLPYGIAMGIGLLWAFAKA